jgi:hypothetical protein
MGKKIKTIRYVISKSTEGVDIITDKILYFLDSLRNIEEQWFSNWYEKGWSKKDALKKKAEFNKEYLKTVVEKNWDKKFPNLGTNISFWSGADKDEECFSIGFLLGKTIENNNLRNIITISFPFSDAFEIDEDDTRVVAIHNLVNQLWVSNDYEMW